MRTGVLSQLKKKPGEKWEVLPVGAKVPFPIKKHETERKKKKKPFTREGELITHTVLF